MNVSITFSESIKILLLFFVITLSMPLFLFTLEKEEVVKAEQGVLDLGKIDSNIFILSGEWEFYWSKLYQPEDFKNLSLEKQFDSIPSTWINKVGYATYRVKVILPEKNRSYALYLNRVNSSYQLWINGQAKGGSGTVGMSALESQPFRTARIYHFDSQEKEAEIILQVSNFHHIQGGVKNSITLGYSNFLGRQVSVLNFLEIFCLGVFLSLSFFQILIYVYQKESFYLFFGVAFFSAFTYTFSTGENIVTMLTPINWWAHLKLAHLSFIIFVTSYTYSLSKLFLQYSVSLLNRFIYFVSVLYTFCVLLTENFYMSILPFYHLIIVLSFFYWCFLSIRAFQDESTKITAYIHLLGLFFLSTAVSLEILYVNSVIEKISTLNLGFLLLAVSHTIFVVKQFKQSTFLAQKYSIQAQKFDKEAKNALGVIEEQQSQLNEINGELEQKNYELGESQKVISFQEKKIEKGIAPYLCKVIELEEAIELQNINAILLVEERKGGGCHLQLVNGSLILTSIDFDGLLKQEAFADYRLYSKKYQIRRVLNLRQPYKVTKGHSGDVTLEFHVFEGKIIEIKVSRQLKEEVLKGLQEKSKSLTSYFL